MVAQDGGGDDDVLLRLMRASSRGMPFEGDRNAHLCLNQGSVCSGVNPHFETVFAAKLSNGIAALRSSVQIKPSQPTECASTKTAPKMGN
jgi:hypothetical protein